MGIDEASFLSSYKIFIWGIHMPQFNIILTASNVDSCPLFDKGDTIVCKLPEVDMESTNKVCAFILAELLKERLVQEKNMICEKNENFITKEAYLSEFGIKEGTLYCPRVSTEVSFSVVVEEESESLDVLQQEFTGRADKKDLINKLKQIPILSAVTPDDLFDLLSEIKIKKCSPGDVIIEKGQQGKHFFILYTGEVEIVQPFQDGAESIIGRLKAGECFGEMSLLTGEVVSATIRACAQSTILILDKVTFRRLMEKNPVMGIMFTKLLSQRIKDTNQRMSMVVAAGMVGQLQTIHFPELIQTLAATDCSGILHLSRKGEQGKVYFQNGEIVDVTLQEESGNECFYQLLRWENGDFRFEQKEVERQRTILCDAMGLLLEGMRRIDEEYRAQYGDEGEIFEEEA